MFVDFGRYDKHEDVLDSNSNVCLQHSEDHRGTPEKPGRVVTLIPVDEWKTIEDVVMLFGGMERRISFALFNIQGYVQHGHDDVTWGVAFKIPSSDAEATRAYLDHREKVRTKGNGDYMQNIDASWGAQNGYTVHTVDIYSAEDDQKPAVKDVIQ